MRPGEQELGRPDAIMERSVGLRIQEFTRAGGSVEDVGRLLSENYVGYAEMVNLIGVWMDEAELGDSEDVIEGAMEDVVRHKFLPSRADHTLFKFNTPPLLMDQLIASERWLPVIKRLHQIHKECGLLKEMRRRWTVREVVGDFDITESLDALSNAITKILKEGLESRNANLKSFAQMQRKIVKLALYDERSFVISLRVLASAEVLCEHQATANVIRRLAQEIRREAVEEISALAKIPQVVARQWAAKYAVIFECVTRGLPVMKNLLDNVLSFVFSESKSKSFQKEISVLAKAYESIWDRRDPEGMQERRALLKILRQPEVLLAMQRALFCTHQDASFRDERRKCLCMLLGCASVPADGNSSDFSGIEDRLLEVTAIVAKLKPGCSAYEIKPYIATFKDALTIPVVAAGMLQWARDGLLSQPRPHMLKVTLNYYLSVVDYVARFHPGFRPSCLQLLFDTFETDFMTERPQDALTDADLLVIRSHVAKGLSNLTRMGCASEVIQFYGKHTSTIDTSMIRHFVKDILNIVKPPFNQEFGQAMLTYLSEQKVLEVTRKDVDTNKLVTEFVRQCTSQQNIVVPHGLVDLFPKQGIPIQQ